MNRGKDGIVLQSHSVAVWDQGARASCLCASLAWEAGRGARCPSGATDIPSLLEPNTRVCCQPSPINLELAGTPGTTIVYVARAGLQFLSSRDLSSHRRLQGAGATGPYRTGLTAMSFTAGCCFPETPCLMDLRMTLKSGLPSSTLQGLEHRCGAPQSTGVWSWGTGSAPHCIFCVEISGAWPCTEALAVFFLTPPPFSWPF